MKGYNLYGGINGNTPRFPFVRVLAIVVFYATCDECMYNAHTFESCEKAYYYLPVCQKGPFKD